MNNYITEVDILDESKECFLTFAEEVLTDRAIPSAEDGLLSSQRKILWTMEDYLKMNSKGKTKKCNAIVGSTLATSYYHGDAACYGVLCKMSQEYLMRYPLIKGQGSLGTQEANDVFASSRYCVAGDTLISTERGLMPIKDIVPESELDSEHDIDLVVQGGFGEKRHASKFFNTGLRDILKIKLRNGLWIKVTPNHPLLTLDENLNIVWKLAKDFSEKDKMLVCYNTNSSCFGQNNDLIEARMLGCMISEGYATTQNRLGINNKDIAMITPVQQYMTRESSSIEASICYNSKREYYEYCIANKTLYNDFVKKYNFKKSDEKCLPNSFYQGTKEYQSQCLAYLFEGDGSVDIKSGISYSSISETLIHQLQVVLLQNFGIISIINRSKTRNEIKLRINNVSVNLFQKEIGFISKRKKDNLQQLVASFNQKTNISNVNICAIHEVTKYVRKNAIFGYAAIASKQSFNNIKTINNAKGLLSEEDFQKVFNIIQNYYYLPIESITQEPQEIAYSIRIDDSTHSFIGNGFVNHNTEAKPSIYTDMMMLDFNKGIVPVKETYNGEFYEPVVLPAFFPNALCNGKQAIGVSMSHNSAPNNLTEVCNGIVAYIKNKEMTITDLMEYIPGPDFPLGGTVINKQDIYEAFATGKSKVSLKIRGDYEIKNNQIIFTTIPYRTYRNKIKEQINKNIDIFDSLLEDFADASCVGKNKLIFTVKKDIDVSSALNKIFTLTDLQTTLSYNMNYIVNGTPKLCSILDLVKIYYQHQSTILIKIAEFDKAKAERRKALLEGLLIALEDIDKAISIIKNSLNKSDARENLINYFHITDFQADGILEMKLARLTKLDREDLLKELKEKKAVIAECQKIISDNIYRDNILIQKIENMKKQYGDERKTKLIQLQVESEKEIKPEDIVVTVLKTGLVKIDPVTSFTVQKRNGKGKKTANKEIFDSLTVNTLDTLLLFSTKGKMYQILAGEIVNNTNLHDLFKIEKDEQIITMTTSQKDDNKKFVIFFTENGYVKKTYLEEYKKMKKSGIIALKLKEGDSIVNITCIDDEDILLATEKGRSIHFQSSEISPTGRNTIGVKGIQLDPNDKILSGIALKKNDNLIAVIDTEGQGKCLQKESFPIQARNGKGIYISKKPLSNVLSVSQEDILLVIGEPNTICISVKELPILKTCTAQGVSIIKNSKIKKVIKI